MERFRRTSGPWWSLSTTQKSFFDHLHGPEMSKRTRKHDPTSSGKSRWTISFFGSAKARSTMPYNQVVRRTVSKVQALVSTSRWKKHHPPGQEWLYRLQPTLKHRNHDRASAESLSNTKQHTRFMAPTKVLQDPMCCHACMYMCCPACMCAQSLCCSAA